MYQFMSALKRLVLPGAILLAIALVSPQVVSGQGGGPAAYYSPSYTDSSWAHIFNLHQSWGNAVPGATRSPNGLWCVHPNYQPGQILVVSANGKTISCTVGDMVNPRDLADWRSKWVVELSWSAFVALDLNQRNVVDSVSLGGVGGAGPSPSGQAEEPAQEEEQPTERHFSQTGFDVSDEFLDFWRENGGLPSFGYPLSEQMDEDGQTVQYFERAVFELHPDNPPEHRVLLRLLGVDASSGLWESDAFQRQPDESGDGRVYFPQTGQHLSGSFLAHWREYGGLRIFGYPISREVEEDGRVVQYFERAVFEWHPENPPEDRVLLRRLGADAQLQ